MESDSRIYVAGAGTFLGQALVRGLRRQGYANLGGLGEAEPDPIEPAAVEAFFARWRPQYVFVAAGPSGGIVANQRSPADFMRENLLVACHVVDAAYRYGATKLLYLGSSCAYPKHCPQPMRVEALLSGRLEPTSEPYALAKLAGMTLCQAYRRQYGARFMAAIPADVFGPGDGFAAETSHVLAGLMRRFHEAKVEGRPRVLVWGSGRPRREFIYCDDLADACVLVMRAYDEAASINLGSGEERSIAELAAEIKAVVGYGGTVEFDPGRPDGMPRKLLDSGPLRALGWRPRIALRPALAETYRWLAQTGVTADVR